MVVLQPCPKHPHYPPPKFTKRLITIHPPSKRSPHGIVLALRRQVRWHERPLASTLVKTCLTGGVTPSKTIVLGCFHSFHMTSDIIGRVSLCRLQSLCKLESHSMTWSSAVGVHSGVLMAVHTVTHIIRAKTATDH